MVTGCKEHLLHVLFSPQTLLLHCADMSKRKPPPGSKKTHSQDAVQDTSATRHHFSECFT